ncbi:13_t:CDS:2, partial [Cetraspora pellucida]
YGHVHFGSCEEAGDFFWSMANKEISNGPLGKSVEFSKAKYYKNSSQGEGFITYIRRENSDNPLIGLVMQLKNRVEKLEEEIREIKKRKTQLVFSVSQLKKND